MESLAIIYGEYPGWARRFDTPLQDASRSIYQQMFGKPLIVEGIFAGLVTGIFAEKWSDMDFIAIGPTITGAHSPDETLDIDSYARFYAFLKKLISSLCSDSDNGNRQVNGVLPSGLGGN
jgi:dipeptidase D